MVPAVSSLRILIVDQDEDMLDLLEDEIKEMGHSVTRASGGVSAIVKASEERFDVVITEVEMSGVMEPQILLSLKRLQPDAAIVAVASVGTELTVREAFRKGADYYMAKPIPMDGLKDFISHLGTERMKFLKSKNPLGRRTRGQGQV